jgi:RNA polymerase sigma-70 factor (ECF subfamily)
VSGWNDLFAEVARTRYSSLVAYGILLTSSRADAQDLVQDAMVKVFSRVRRVPNAAAADQYIRRAMYTLYLDDARRAAVARSARRAVALPAEVPDAGVAIGDAAEVRAALATLSAQERACVVLRYFDDLTVPGIAGVLGLAEGTVKRYLSDAHAKLGSELAPGDPPSERIPVVPPEGGRHG